MKALLVSFSYPPVAGPGLERALELAQALPALGVETHVLSREDDGNGGSDPAARVPTQAWVHRTRHLGGTVPALDEGLTWNLTAIPAAIRLVRAHHIDRIVTVAPPHSVHLVGAAVKRATGASWLADLGERPGDSIAWLVTRQADAIACSSDGLAEAMQARRPSGRVSVRAGADTSSAADLLRSLA